MIKRCFMIRRLIQTVAVVVAVSIFGRVDAADTALLNCVQPVHPLPLSQLANTDAVGTSQDIGNVTVMDLSGDYDRGLDAPRQQVAARFYAAHPDQYDFLIVFTTFEFPTAQAIAFYRGLRNDTQGIGQPIFDYSAAYGSAGKLQGYTDMAAMSRYDFVPDSPSYHVAFDTLAHEIMHHWGVHLHFLDGNGVDSSDLIGQDNSHWSYFLDTDASVMYGADWQLQGDGKFHSVDTRHRYSPLDMYVAGFAAPSEVPPFTLIRNGDGGVATDYPKLGAVSGGQGESITIDQVIAASGQRIPSATDSQKDFTGAIILLKRPGESVSANQLLELERFRVRFEQQFVANTSGRGTMRLYTQTLGTAAVGPPAILHGSGTTANLGGVAAAVAWLESRQAADGHWQDRPATSVRDTVAVARLLDELDPAFTGLALAHSWIAAHAIANLDQQAWKLLGADLGADATALAALQDSSGGFAIKPGWSASAFDTSMVAAALAHHDANAPSLAAALSFVGTQQNADGSYGAANGGHGRVLPTLRAANFLASSGDSTYAQSRQHAADWIGTQQAGDGGIGGVQQSSLAATIEVYSLSARLPLSAQVITGSRSYVTQNQQTNGDWGGSVYLTATAALAYAHDQRANLALIGTPTINPAHPYDGALATLSAVVANTGNVPTPATVARWFDGDPDHGGVQIGADIAVANLSAGSSTSITQTWDTSGRLGDHVLWLALDADSTVNESSELDNRGSLAVNVQAPSDLPDLVLNSSDFTLNPASVTTLPSQVHLSGLVRNIGNQDSGSVVVRVYAKPDLTTALAETTITVPARGTAPVALDFNVTKAATLNLLVRVDPDNAIAEADETNNDASLTLPYGQSLDLEVTPADIVQTGATPLAGHDVNFDVSLHNRGTIDSPPAIFHAEIVQNGVTTTIFDAPVQIVAGQTVLQHLTWRADQPGSAQLRVSLDPTNQIVETREDNNTAQLDFNVAALDQADLTFVSDSLSLTPTPGLQGQPLTATLGVRNLSSVATGSFSVALYAADPRTGAPAMGSAVVASLGGSSDTTVTVNVADLGITGDQTLYAFVDANNQIAEIDETNNVIIKQLRVIPLPDVAISVADVVLNPALPVPGQPVEAKITVRNLGGQDAHNVVVRLLEGDATTGVAVGANQNITVLAAGAATTLIWDWTLGVAPDSRSVTAIADPDNTVREGSEDNNNANLPFDVQNGDFFASERYISPNGDGIQDATAVVFVMPQAGSAQVNVVNGAQYTVRHFANVELNGELRGQVVWDGRDDRGRIVPDGDYYITAIDAEHQSHLGPQVTVDNDLSSFLEAVDTPYGIDAGLPRDNYGQGFYNTQIPPPTSPLRDQLYGMWIHPVSGQGLYRTETVFPNVVPVISGSWLEKFRLSHQLKSVGIDQFAFDPSGQNIVVSLSSNSTANGNQTWIVMTAVDQSDSATLLATFGYLSHPEVLGFFDQATIVAGPTPDGLLHTIDSATGTASVLRSLSDAPSYQETRVVPSGILLLENDNYENDPQAFVPRDSAKAIIDFHSIPHEDNNGNYNDDTYHAQLSPQLGAVAVYERNQQIERVDLIDLASGSRRNLLQSAPGIARLEQYGIQTSMRRYGMGWLEHEDELLVQDATARTAIAFSESGQRISQAAFPELLRVGNYELAYGQNPEASDPANVFSTAPSSLVSPSCSFSGTDFGVERRVYDPTNNRFYLTYGETIAHNGSEGGGYFEFNEGIRDLFSADIDSGQVDTLQKGTLTPLIESADIAQHPLRDECTDTPPADWPALILRDGARIRTDGHVQTLSRGVLPKVWKYHNNISQIWPDETRMVSGNQSFSSLLNLTAILQARTLGRGIELSGVAADRNFAYYKLDWAPIEQPNNWQVLTPASSDEVFLDEFLTWVPPQPGTFVIRLTIVDKAGNTTTSKTTASSFDSSLIDSFSLAPRYISPNGDGVQDQLIVKYRVRAPMTLYIRIDDNNGNTVRSMSTTYGNGTLGPQEFDWDGRNDGGQVVPDGRYRINVDGFAAWVTVDTLAPTLSGTLIQPYQSQGTTDQSGLPKNGYAIALPAAKYVVQEVNLDHVSVERSQKGSSAWYSANFDPRGDSGRTEFGLYTYRVTASDRAGNTTALNLGPGEEQLIATAIGGGIVRYQTPPVTGLLNVNIEPPIDPVAVDQADDVTVSFVDESGYLVRVAVETALSNVPDQWTQRGIAEIGTDCPPNTNSCKASFNTLAMPLGAPTFLRLRGERTDGSVLYSNQGYIKVGGIDPPVCKAMVFSDAYISAMEYFDGPLASATLHYTSNTGVPSQAKIASPEDATVHFIVPADPKSVAWVEGIDQHGIYHVSKRMPLDCPVPSGGDENGSAWQFTLRPHPVVSRDQCDGQPGNQIALGFRTEYASSESMDLKLREKGFIAPIPTHLRLSYVDGITNLPVTLFDGAVDASNAAAIGQTLTISTLNWPEGSYEGRLEATDPDGKVHSTTVEIPVLKQAPQSEIVTPSIGGRVCALPSIHGESISLGLRINSPAENAFHIEIGAGSHPLSWRCLGGAGAVANVLDPDCAPLITTQDLVGKSLESVPPVSVEGALEPYNGAATLRLRSVGWSGGSVCVDTTVFLDSDVEFAQRKEPTSVIPPSVDLLGISAVGDQKYAQANFFFKANEPVTATATVFRYDTLETFPLKQFDGVQGDVDLAWNGQLDGAFAPDGAYQVAVVANDDCTHPKTLRYQVQVDSTPPAIELTSPASGPTAAAIIHIAGSVTDNFQLSSWSLDYALAGSVNNWQNLAHGSSPIAIPAVLADWSRGSLTGTVDLRLSAVDILGNRSETHVPITLLDPAKLIGGAELQPPLFSPNADGTLDSTRLQLSLLRDATVAVRVENAAQSTVANVYSGPSPAGSSGFAWNGQDSDGHVVPDGVYGVVIDAQDPNGLAVPEKETLTVTVDNLAPILTVQQPTGAFAPATASVIFHTEDLHFTSYATTLTRSVDGVVVASANGTQGGDITLAALKDFQEGAYALHIVARDGAGNATTRDSTFNVDTTPPVVTLTSPDDAALIAAAKPTSVTGSVNDAHLATYALSVAPTGTETWTDLKQGSANIDAGEILAWTPNLPDGVYRLRLRGVDQAGNTTDVTHSVEVDGTPPVAKISSPVNGALVRTQIEIDGSATDAHFAAYRISIATTVNAAAGQWADVYSGTTAVDAGKLAALTLNLPEDNYVLRLTVTDKVGLSSTDQVNVRIDTQPPPVPLGLIGHVENHRDAILDWNAVTASDLAGYNLY
ncbi:MAG: CARDB domain-containing protein, partial [Rudaea sp.]